MILLSLPSVTLASLCRAVSYIIKTLTSVRAKYKSGIIKLKNEKVFDTALFYN